MSRIEIEITKDNNGLKKGHKSKVESVYAIRMVDAGLAKYVNKDESEAIKKAEAGAKKQSDEAKSADKKKSSDVKAKQQKLDKESKEAKLNADSDAKDETVEKKKPSKSKK